MERSDFRIVERHGGSGESLFYIQVRKNKMVGGLFGLFGELTEVWEDLFIKTYNDDINKFSNFSKTRLSYGFKRRAEEDIQIYINHLDRKIFEYRGQKLIPILYYSFYATRELVPIYYDPKSSGYKERHITYHNVDDFKKNVDQKLDKGKLIKIHN
jgi:hypothetical protein